MIDIEYIANHRRKQDALEFSYTSKDASGSLIKAFYNGEVVLIATVNGKPVCAFCVAKKPIGNTEITKKRYCWMVGTDDLDTLGIAGIRRAMQLIGDVSSLYAPIFSYANDENRRAHRFMQALGFKHNGEKYNFGGHTASYYERIK